MIRRLFIAVLSLLIVMVVSFAGLARAHGSHEHLMGTITSLADRAVTVKISWDRTEKVAVDDSTKYEQDGKPAKFSDLKLGQRAVIHAAPRDGGTGLVATTVKVASK